MPAYQIHLPDAAVLAPYTVNDYRRFWGKVLLGDNCWVWTGFCDPEGYGSFWHKHKQSNVRAHRVSWEMTYGQIPDGLFVCHRCDNPSCVRPCHLFLGDHVANMADMMAKGRGRKNSLAGEKHVWAKLSEASVAEIRRLSDEGGHSQREIARLFGICQPHVSDIVNKKKWACSIAAIDRQAGAEEDDRGVS